MVDLSPRQQQLLNLLQSQREALTGTDLASICKVTRQVVVHDIAILRAAGHNILSTPRGYVMASDAAAHRPTRILAVCHPPELTEAELTTLVDYGIAVRDVIIEHPLYGELHGNLHLASRKDVECFIQQVQASSAGLLSSLTDGHHLHTIEYTSESRLTEAIAQLRRLGIEVL
ncbi:transcription repressor NadR [Alicyclobacillus cycloheptanicus]|uniref:Transcriptional regulator of NAD metabolism n=1 Tax=Alicyclobacillus cycloheptanicus TaxID=1457 RepID=A0ABT9XFU7_9BACL|nr:transcription repressor NadR [Alicyclobacillus cycloheptanicus]MDQ0189171.1 transcriptional regulator of NAD metabolism [Alicyclobacillus cycloheptanicus]WDM00361.1 transcription repressor NadR [Alicyclobacillus cycloheptanicus]